MALTPLDVVSIHLKEQIEHATLLLRQAHSTVEDLLSNEDLPKSALGATGLRNEARQAELAARLLLTEIERYRGAIYAQAEEVTP